MISLQCPGLFTDIDPNFRIQAFLEKIQCGLSRVVVPLTDVLVRASGAPSRAHLASLWIGRCAALFRVNPRAILMTLQAEQSLLSEKRELDPAVSIVRPASICPPGTRIFMDRSGVAFGVLGDWRMVAAAGAGIPEKGGKFWIKPEFILGFDFQVYQCAKTIRKLLDMFNRKVTLSPLGEHTDKESFVLAHYTPHLEALGHRPAMYHRYFSHA